MQRLTDDGLRAMVAWCDKLHMPTLQYGTTDGRLRGPDGHIVATYVLDEIGSLLAAAPDLAREVLELRGRKAVRCAAEDCMGGHVIDWDVPKVNGLPGSSPCPNCGGSGAVLVSP